MPTGFSGAHPASGEPRHNDAGIHRHIGLTGEVLQFSRSAELHRTAWTITGVALVVWLRPLWGLCTVLQQPRPYLTADTITPLPEQRAPEHYDMTKALPWICG